MFRCTHWIIYFFCPAFIVITLSLNAASLQNMSTAGTKYHFQDPNGQIDLQKDKKNEIVSKNPV